MRAVDETLTRRLRHRWGATAALSVTTVALAACGSGDRANQNNPLGYDNGAAPAADGLETYQAVLLFGLVPLVLLLLVSALVWLPGMVRSNRYRPNRGWGAAPLWFAGPPDPAAAVESASAGDTVRGGASGDW